MRSKMNPEGKSLLDAPILRVNGLQVEFETPLGTVKAIDGATFEVRAGETLTILGESGSGKSVSAAALMGLVPSPPGRISAGQVLFEGRDLVTMSARAMRKIQGDKIAMVFQDAITSLNPGLTVGYPHQFSGGQRQRIGIARALAMSPRVLICDEPVSALDVSVQAQVINLLTDLRQDLGISLIFIAHNLQIVRHISDRIAVMYLGKIVEIGTWDEIYDRATHPYTQALISAIPDPDPKLAQQRILLKGDVPDPANPPSGCRFRTRCWKAQDLCARETPELKIRQDTDHPSACHFAQQRQDLKEG